MLGGGQQLVVLRKTSLWLLLALVSSGQQAGSGTDYLVLIILDGLSGPVLSQSGYGEQGVEG